MLKPRLDSMAWFFPIWYCCGLVWSGATSKALPSSQMSTRDHHQHQNIHSSHHHASSFNMITVGSILAMLLPLNAFVSAGILPQLSQLTMPDFNNSGYSTLPDVQTFAALGDSFATGMGAGKMLGIPIFSGHWWCSRYGNSYGSLVFNDMPRPKATRKFHNYACSGHNIDTITKKQLPQLKNGNYDAVSNFQNHQQTVR